LSDIITNVAKSCSKQLDRLEKLPFITKDEKKVLNTLKNLYDSYEKETILKFLDNFDKETQDLILKSVPKAKEIEKNILTPVNKEEYEKEMNELLRDI